MMFKLLFLLSSCVSQIIEVKFNQSIWEGEFQSSSNNTYRITQSEQQQVFYTIDVRLDERNQNFMLLANNHEPISNPFSPNLKDGENIDLINLQENRLERFLVISSSAGDIYITTISNVEGRTYRILIKKDPGWYKNGCQNNCNKQGYCYNYKCYCDKDYIGVDCKYFATEIKSWKLFKPNFTTENDLVLMSFPTNLYPKGYKVIIKFQTNDLNGYQILAYKTNAIINPLDKLSHNTDLCELYEVSKNKELEFNILVSDSLDLYQRANFGIKSINPNFASQDLEILFIPWTKRVEKKEPDRIAKIIEQISLYLVLFLFVIALCCPINRGESTQNVNIDKSTQNSSMNQYLPQQVNLEEECSICLGSLNSALVRQTICNHQFHIQCINLWLQKGNHKCPLCRQQLKFKEQNLQR